MSLVHSLFVFTVPKTFISSPLTKALTKENPVPNRATSWPVIMSWMNRYAFSCSSRLIERSFWTSSTRPWKTTGVFSIPRGKLKGSLTSLGFGGRLPVRRAAGRGRLPFWRLGGKRRRTQQHQCQKDDSIAHGFVPWVDQGSPGRLSRTPVPTHGVNYLTMAAADK